MDEYEQRQADRAVLRVIDEQDRERVERATARVLGDLETIALLARERGATSVATHADEVAGEARRLRVELRALWS